ncbi:HAD family hydrolase [Chloroflexota bacterium]
MKKSVSFVVDGLKHMTYSAVIFDLFGTLVSDIMGPLYQQVAEQMAKILSIPSEKFSDMWFGTIYERNIGIFETIQDNIRFICKKLNTDFNEDQIFKATQIRYEYVRRTMTLPRVHSLETLAELRKKGIKIGLLSDCSSSEVDIWPGTPFPHFFDVTVFSSSVKLKKPDLKIFQLAARKLHMREKQCVYVGNGGSNEIEGSFKSGMFPMLILPESKNEPTLQTGKDIIEYAQEHGKVIGGLNEILEVFK